MEAGQRLKSKDGPGALTVALLLILGASTHRPAHPSHRPPVQQQLRNSLPPPGGLPGSPQQADLGWGGPVVPSTSTRSSLLSCYLLPTSERQVPGACHPSLTPGAPITRPGQLKPEARARLPVPPVTAISGNEGFSCTPCKPVQLL